MKKGKTMLIVVDPQIDFTTPQGTLYVKGAEGRINAINDLLEHDGFDFRVITQDWHPHDHVSFASVNGTVPFTTKQSLQGGHFITQTMWPNHCAAGTKGAEILPMIISNRADAIWRKGTNQMRESYSVFEYANENDGPLSERIEDQTVFYDLVDNAGFVQIYVCGFALDYCVMHTAKSALSLGNVAVVADACQAVDETKRTEILELAESIGIGVINTSDLVRRSS